MTEGREKFRPKQSPDSKKEAVAQKPTVSLSEIKARLLKRASTPIETDFSLLSPTQKPEQTPERHEERNDQSADTKTEIFLIDNKPEIQEDTPQITDYQSKTQPHKDEILLNPKEPIKPRRRRWPDNVPLPDETPGQTQKTPTQIKDPDFKSDMEWLYLLAPEQPDIANEKTRLPRSRNQKDNQKLGEKLEELLAKQLITSEEAHLTYYDKCFRDKNDRDAYLKFVPSRKPRIRIQQLAEDRKPTDEKPQKQITPEPAEELFVKELQKPTTEKENQTDNASETPI